ncbi:hypothetical protein [Actinomadura verrucosospora]
MKIGDPPPDGPPPREEILGCAGERGPQPHSRPGCQASAGCSWACSGTIDFSPNPEPFAIGADLQEFFEQASARQSFNQHVQWFFRLVGQVAL